MSYIKRLVSLYTENNELEFRITTSQYNIIKQLVRMQLAELIENDASDKTIDHFTAMDLSLSNQYDEMMRQIEYYNNIDEDDRPF
jgi:hypothetical protein